MIIIKKSQQPYKLTYNCYEFLIFMLLNRWYATTNGIVI